MKSTQTNFSRNSLVMILVYLMIFAVSNATADVSFSKLFGPQFGVAVSKQEYVHLRTGLTLKCCAKTNSLYGNQTGLSGQVELTPHRWSLQPGVVFQWRYRNSGSWVVRPYYFYSYPFSGPKKSGGGLTSSSPYGGITIEMSQTETLLALSWDF